MAERPILFSAPMVRAILEGRKTQTRRIVKNAPEWADTAYDAGMGASEWWDFYSQDRHERPRLRCPYGKVGGQLWVKETWRVCDHDFGIPPCAWLLHYKADGDRLATWEDWRNPPESEREAVAKKFGTAHAQGGPDPKIRPSIFMPRWASRITLEVKEVRVQRLQEISVEDAVAEGVLSDDVVLYGGSMTCSDAPFAYSQLWDQINGKGSWDLNPFVWAITFEQLRATHGTGENQQ